MEKWDYKSLKVEGAKLEETMRPLGEQGWEVVNFVPVIFDFGATDATGGTFYWAVTKWQASEYRVLLKRRKA